MCLLDVLLIPCVYCDVLLTQCVYCDALLTQCVYCDVLLTQCVYCDVLLTQCVYCDVLLTQCVYCDISGKSALMVALQLHVHGCPQQDRTQIIKLLVDKLIEEEIDLSKVVCQQLVLG